jgi:pyruvate formate lyase activating enzyme
MPNTRIARSADEVDLTGLVDMHVHSGPDVRPRKLDDLAVAREAKAAGLPCAFVSNGNATPEALDFLRPWLVAYKIDLKSFDDQRYRTLGGTLEHVTQGIRLVHERGLWLEVVTLLVPGFNDSEAELRQMAQFLVSVSPNIPWHVTAFHQDYKMTGPKNTPAATLERAARIGREAGLRFVYAGNLPGAVGDLENTYCPGCRAALVQRIGHRILSNRLTAGGKCPDCGTVIPGIWRLVPQADDAGHLVHFRCG